MPSPPPAARGADLPRARRLARLLWPVPLVLLAVSGAASLGVDLDFEAVGVGAFALIWVLPYGLAVGFVGYAIGGRRGIAASVALTALVIWWVYTFSFDFSATLDAPVLNRIAQGLVDAGAYHLGILIALWPIAVAVVVLTVVVALVRRRRLWPTLGLLTLAGTLLLTPTGAGWDDGCNGRYGASPLITKPTAGALMDRGVQVIPSGAGTLMACGDEDREFKPFWEGDDGLPPAPRITGWVSQTDLVFPAALPSAGDAWLRDRPLRVAMFRSTGAGSVYVMLRTARPLAPTDAWTVRLDGVPADGFQTSTPRNRSGSCAVAAWTGRRLKGYRGPAGPVDWTVYRRPEERPRVTVTVERNDRVLARTQARLRADGGARADFRTALGCAAPYA